MNSKLKLIAACALVLLMQSCIKVNTGTTVPTLGEQLIDLGRAKQLGELSDKEFAELRRKALASF